MVQGIKKIAGLLVLLICVTTRSGQAATVTTDQIDYPPGTTATITGTGFLPGETVELQVLRVDINENSGAEHVPWQVSADADGNFLTTWYVAPDEEGATLQLSANGLSSGMSAQWVFTDGNSVTTINTVSITAQTNAATYGTANAAITYTVTVNYTTASSGNGGLITPSNAILPAGITASWNPTSIQPAKNQTGDTTFTLTLSTTSAAAATNLSFTVTATGQNGTPNSGTVTGALLISPKALTVSGVTASNKVYDGNTLASLSGGTLSGIINGDTVTLVSGSGAFSSKNVGSRSVTASGYSLGGSGAAKYTLPSQPTVANATITAAPLAVIANNASREFGANNPSFTASYSGFVSGENVAAISGSPSFATSDSTNSAPGAYAIVPSVGTLTATNYSFNTFSNGVLTINKANVSLTLATSVNPATNASGVYFTATTATSGIILPTGSVQLLTNGVACGSPVALVNGSAQFIAPANLAHGYTSVFAQFTGGSNFNNTSSATITQLVNNRPTGSNKTMGATQNQKATVIISKWLNRLDRDADGDMLTISSYDQSTAQGGSVLVANGGITYTPATNFFGSDSFTYTVTDGYTNLTLSVVVNVVSENAGSGNILSLTPPNFPGSQGARVKFLGMPGSQRYVQYRSLASGSWTTFSTNTIPANGVLEVEDSSSLNDLSGRTYRTSTKP